MNKSVSFALALSLLSLVGCQKSFDLNTPLYDKSKGAEATSVAYLKTDDFTFAQIASTRRVAQDGASVTNFNSQECYVYLSKPADQDVKVTVSLDNSEASLTTYTKTLSSNPGFRMAPEGYAKLSATTVTIPKGKTKSETAITIEPGDKYVELSTAQAFGEYYLVALKVAAVQGPAKVGVSKLAGTYFLPIEKSYNNVSLTTDAATGTQISASDLEYEASSARTYGGYVYGVDQLHDGSTSSWWLADIAKDPLPVLTIMHPSGTKKFTDISIQTQTNYITAVRELEIFITKDGKTWFSQGNISAYDINRKQDVRIHFSMPVEAKGVKIAAVRKGYARGYYGMTELSLYATE